MQREVLRSKAFNLWQVFRDVTAEYPFHSFRFFFGSVLVGVTQVVSIGSLFPIISTISGQKDPSNRFIQYFDQLLIFLGLDVGLANYLFLFIAIASLSAGIFIVVEIDQGKFLRKLEGKLRQSLMKTVIDARWQELRDLNHGEFINAVSREADLYKIVVKYIFIILSTSIQVIFLSYFMLSVNVKFTVISLIFLFLGFIVFMPLMKLANQLGHSWTNAFARLTSSLVNSVRAFKNIKTGSLEKFLLKYLKPIVLKVSHIYYKQQVLTAVQMKSTELMGICILAILLYIGVEVIKLEISQLVVVLVVLYRITPKVKELSDYLHRAYGSLPSIMKIQNIKKQCTPEREKVKEKNYKILKSPIQTIHFQSVGMQYDPKSKLFDSLAVKFQKGEFWAICGPTGSGKTTILDLISGIIEPSFGHIMYDGINSREIKLNSLHQRIGYITQNSFIFAGSILENISWGHENPDLSRLDLAIQLSQLDDLISEKTLNFPISESGQNLSGGEQQRIAIARILLKSHDFILMDEPSSALDLKTERKFLSALGSLKGKIGIIMVTHRKEFLKRADYILQFKGHKVKILPVKLVKDNRKIHKD